MAKTKVQTKAPESAARQPIVQKQPQMSEQQGVRSLDAARGTSVLPPPNGLPPAARAAELMRTPAQRPGLISRARTMSAMQQTMGNARVSRLLGTTIQAKLTVGAPNDVYEQEAERVADTVLRMPAPQVEPTSSTAVSPRVQRYCSACKNKLQCQPGSEEAPTAGGDLCPACAQQLQRQMEDDEAPVQRQTEDGSPDVTPDIESHIRTTRGGGAPLSATTRRMMEPRFGQDFSQVRVHTDSQSQQASQTLNAQAFTTGQDIYFGAGRYQPGTPAGDKLLAHELTHTVQQSGGSELNARPSHPMLQRDIPEAELPSTPDSTIHRDPNYLDNGIQRVEFYTAELAIIHYEDGAQLRLGLVPGLIRPPVEGVDYRTPRSEHIQLDPGGAGRTRFLPRGRQIRAPEMTVSQVVQAFSRTITYRHEPTSHRIVPTEVNDITAPRLCQVLRQAEAVYVRNMDELARGMVEFLEVLEIALIIASFIPTSGAARGAVGAGAARGTVAAGAAEAGAVGRAVPALRQLFVRLLRSGGTGAITVEGVGFGGIRAVMSEGRVMTIFRSSILNIGRVPGQGRLIHSAFEQAAVLAAREAGATSVRVAVETVVNPRWSAYLESIGYAFEMIPNAYGNFHGISRVLMKTLTL